MTRQDLLWALPVLAAVLLPGLSWIASGYPLAAQLRLGITIDVFAAVAAAVVFAIIYFSSGRRLRWSLSMTTMTLLVLFQWWILTSGGQAIVDIIPIGLLGDVIPVAVAGLMLWLAARLGQDRAFAMITAIGLWGVVLILVFVTASVTPRIPAGGTESAAGPGQPDVLLLVLDGYPRADVLDSVFGYDNSGFLGDLETMGFVIADRAQANYSYTYGALSSMLALDYVFDVGPIDDDERAAMRHALAGDSPLLRAFKERGYEISYYENAWQGSRCSPYVDNCVRDGIAERALWNLSRTTIFAPIYGAVRPNPFVSVSFSHLEDFGSHATDGGQDRPLLTVFHALVPHQPFLLNPQCELQASPPQSGFDATSPETVALGGDLFVDQLECVNNLVLEGLDQILTDRPDTIVMVTGDHGSESALAFGNSEPVSIPHAFYERMGIMSAYRLPGCKELVYPAMTPINGARAVVACSQGSEAEMLPDRSLWATEDKFGEVSDITERIPAIYPGQ
ncbi:MAG: hypothetical protein QNJ75_06545 [Acidimicrobiia bacterium]|nr:hypothetical protein [Acidimicrobiia bacterium]